MVELPHINKDIGKVIVYIYNLPTGVLSPNGLEYKVNMDIVYGMLL